MSESDRLYLRSILEQESDKKYPGMSATEHFEYFSAEQLLKPFDVDVDDIESGHVGASDDGGVDSAYFLLDRRVVREDPEIASFKSRREIPLEFIVIQSKMANGFSEEAILKLQAMVNDLLDPTADQSTAGGVYSAKLRAIVKRFSSTYLSLLTQRPTLTISFYFTALADSANPEPERKAKLLLERLQDLYSGATCKFAFVTAKDLLTLYRKVTPQTLPLKSSKSLSSSQFGNAYVCLVPIGAFFEFITSDGQLREDLFDSNVRDYEGNVVVNKGIESTLSSTKPVEFWWLNNGITILATTVTGSGDTLAVEEPEIVNGLQTSRKIYEHFNGAPEGDRQHLLENDKRNVLVRVIATTDPFDRDSIIIATNSQTHIEPATFHAGEDIQRRIEGFLPTAAQLYYERRKNYYRNRGIPVAKIVSIAYLAQAVAAIVLQRPDDAYARPTSILRRNYSGLFDETYNPKLYSECARLMKRVDAYLKGIGKDKLDASAQSDIRFYLAMYVACDMLRSASPTRDAIAGSEIHTASDEVLSRCLETVVTAYRVAGGGDEAAKGTELLAQIKKALRHRFPPPRRETQSP